jgi:hypothetical protein
MKGLNIVGGAVLGGDNMKRGTFKEAWIKYWPMYLFIIFTAISLLFKNRVFADYERNIEINKYERAIVSVYENEFEIKNICKFYSMNADYDACQTFAEKRDFYKKNAERCLNDAKNMCWYFPAKLRDKSFYAFSLTTSMAVPGDFRSKAVASLVTTLIEYGADCYEEWTNINTKLYWAQHHYEMYEFYSDLIKQQQM